MQIKTNFFLTYYNIKTYIILFSFLSFLFFWDINIGFFQVRFLNILPLLFSAINFFSNNFNQKNLNAIKFTSIFAFLIFLHLFINIYFDSKSLSFHSAFSFIFLILIFFVAYEYQNFFIDYKYKIILIFFLIFLFSTIISFFFYKNDQPFYCGGIGSNFFLLKNSFFQEIIQEYREDFFNNSSLLPIKFNLSFKEFIFGENSYLAMSAVSLILFSIFSIFTNNKPFYFKILTFMFLIICLIKSSTTLLLGTIVSASIIFLVDFKRINFKTKIAYFLLILLFTTIFFNDKQCKIRLIPSYNSTEIINEKVTNKILNVLNLPSEGYGPGDVEGYGMGSISGGVYFHALKISFISIKERPFGWGLNRYENAFKYFNEKYFSTGLYKNSNLKDYNSKDGSSNLNKLVVEFGIFGILLYIFFIFYTFSKKIPIEQKIFLLPFLITQSLRGAGYFNGGFALVVFLVIISYLRCLIKK